MRAMSTEMDEDLQHLTQTDAEAVSLSTDKLFTAMTLNGMYCTAFKQSNITFRVRMGDISIAVHIFGMAWYRFETKILIKT